MKIEATQQAGVCIVSVSGSVDSLTSDEAESFLDQQIERGETRLVLDLTDVNYMSSSGLRVLMGTLKSTRQHKGDLYLAGLQNHIHELLDLAGFTSIFKIYSTSTEAVAAFSSR